MRTRIRWRTWLAALAVVLVGMPAIARAEDPTPPFIAPDAKWLDVVNYYRAMAGLNPVTETRWMSDGAYKHSCYMLYNTITHYEEVGKPGYTTEGELAGRSGNVAVSSKYQATSRSHIELWMTGPFHAIGVLRSRLTNVGYGKCDIENTPTWHSGATLNVISGLNYAIPAKTTPTLFPGNGTTTNLSRFVVESPNPLDACTFKTDAGLPVIAMMPEAVTSVSASMTGPNGPLQICKVWSGTTTGVAQQILQGENAVSVIPKGELVPGKYTVTITTNARTVKWSFTVDPTAATGIMPIPQVSTVGASSGFTAVKPFRYADSRVNSRITYVKAMTPKRIQVAGIAGLPSDITALSANFTVVNPRGKGYLTVYNCADSPPTASTLNYQPYETVANAGIFPLNQGSYKGSLCVYALVDTDLVIDVNGYLRPSATQRFESLTPTKWVDTATGLNATGRMRKNQTITMNAYTAGIGVPGDAKAVVVNIAGVLPDTNGYLTAYPCGITRPVVSNLNPRVGQTTQNLAIVPLAANGSMCLYAKEAMHVRVDVLGYMTTSGTGTLTPTAPTRVVDTRDLYRTEMNLGTNGSMLSAGALKTVTLAGQRGIPATARALSVNITAVQPTAAGYLTVWECGTQPPTRTISYSAGKVIPLGMEVKLSAGGELCMRASTRTHVVVDVTGYWG